MERIVHLERNALRASVRRPTFAHEWIEYDGTAPEQLAERLHDATIAIVNKLPLAGELLGRLPRLRLIAVAATGTNNIDLTWCRDHGLPVTNIRGYAVHAVAEHVMMLVLALRRQLLAYRQSLQAGRWQSSEHFCFFDHPIRDLHGATLGLVGRGSLGNAVAGLAEAFGMHVVWSERKGAATVRPGYLPFADVLANADVLSLHCPLTQDTRHLIGAAELAAMKRGALLINTARGGLVDEAALAEALRNGTLAGAGFDVLGNEPPRQGNPLLDLNLPNFILTPHVAWASDAAMQTLADQLIDNIEAFARGEIINRVV
jgi:glycerate dehydrogenase